MGRARIVLLGDSLTQQSFDLPSGFGAYLSSIYQRRADVLNRGFSGYNTDWILQYLSTEDGRNDIFGPDDKSVMPSRSKGKATPTESAAIEIVSIFFGANDASDAALNPRQHVPLDRFRSNLKEIIRLVQESCPHAKTLIVTPPPVHEEGRLRFQKERFGTAATGECERTLELSRIYAEAADATAKEAMIPCLNLWKEMQQQCNELTDQGAEKGVGSGELWHALLSDGLHLSAKGNELVGRLLEETIAKHFPDLAVTPDPVTGSRGNSGSRCEGLNAAGPWHDEINLKDVSIAFQKKI